MARRPIRTLPVLSGAAGDGQLDVCHGHGAVLDAGELHQIVTFIQDGGLDRARTMKLEEMRDGERRLKNIERKATRDRRASGESPWSVTGEWGTGLIDLIDLITNGPT